MFEILKLAFKLSSGETKKEAINREHFANDLLIIEEKIETDIFFDHTVIIEANADVNADIYCGECLLYGKFRGSLNCKGKVEIFPGARVYGFISSSELEVDSPEFLLVNNVINNEIEKNIVQSPKSLTFSNYPSPENDGFIFEVNISKEKVNKIPESLTENQTIAERDIQSLDRWW